MNNFTRDFISEEKREYKIKIGQLIASSLSGFIGGAVVASIVWVIILKSLEIL